MFKTDKPSEMSAKHFGAGSTIEAGNNKYLVVSSESDVCCVSLSTFEVVGCWTKVQDINYLTSKEARTLVDKGPGNALQYTYTDFDLIPKGLKNV